MLKRFFRVLRLNINREECEIEKPPSEGDAWNSGRGQEQVNHWSSTKQLGWDSLGNDQEMILAITSLHSWRNWHQISSGSNRFLRFPTMMKLASLCFTQDDEMTIGGFRKRELHDYRILLFIYQNPNQKAWKISSVLFVSNQPVAVFTLEMIRFLFKAEMICLLVTWDAQLKVLRR